MRTLFISFFILLSTLSFGQTSKLILKEYDRKRLDTIVINMVNRNEPDDKIRSVVSDFKKIYGYNPDDWTYVSESANEIKYYIKKLIINSNTSDFWVKSVSKTNEYTIEHWKIYCRSSEIAILSATEYTAKGLVKLSEEYPGTLQSIIPDSVAEGIQNFVCEKPIY